ncbi:NAD(P)/FAD-dependent oxidoreductase [Cohnella suwonensis]|uniref:NAD(P)/FAD-dependent oxidoreductase n=1 Tax=Cohnella suwonensis TaxID=696072 RepID=A0ABW0M2J7_9BACL
MLDCAIIGGGPAGLSAALVLGRSRRNVALFDDDQARNKVTQESHGFLTRDGIKPSELREIARDELKKYPSVVVRDIAIVQARRLADGTFVLVAKGNEQIRARTIILATGLKEILPDISGLKEHYGKSLFSCPYCDGWEIRDRPLVVISEHPHAYHLAVIASHWSMDLAVCTNGANVLPPEQIGKLASRGIRVYGQRIALVKGSEGRLQNIAFADGTELERTAGFVGSQLVHATPFAEMLGCAMNEKGGIVVDDVGRTTAEGVFAAGDNATVTQTQIVFAAAGGSLAAMGVNAALTFADF